MYDNVYLKSPDVDFEWDKLELRKSKFFWMKYHIFSPGNGENDWKKKILVNF